jgi:glutathione S-transferase
MSASELRDFVLKSRCIRAPRERVFHAWTCEEDLAAWWRPGRYRVEAVHIDLRVGGAYEILMLDPNGQRQRLFGVYVEVVAPERLVMTWTLEGSPADDGYEALLTLEFREASGNTLLRLTHEKLRPSALKNFDAGWEGLLPKLANQLEAPAEHA